MPIDLSGVLRTQVGNARKEYEKALAARDAHAASDSALKCARFCRLLAENVPEQAKSYLEDAAQWEKIGKQIQEKGLKQAERTSGSGGGDKSETPFEDFHSYAEGLIRVHKTTWADIAGLDEPKRLLQIMFPIEIMQKPIDLKLWEGIMLYGPPGTGKTPLPTAAAGSMKLTFFAVPAKAVLSKWVGETSHLIGAIYDVARSHAPSIVFFDEIDALAMSRDRDQQGHDVKMLSTLLDELQGFESEQSSALVLTLAATNKPWNIDSAALSRFSRQIYIRLPDSTISADTIGLYTTRRGLDTSGLDMAALGKRCEKKLYSGREIYNLCREAILAMIGENNPRLIEYSTLTYEELVKKALQFGAMKDAHFESAFQKIQSRSSPREIAKYDKWEKNGSLDPDER